MVSKVWFLLEKRQARRKEEGVDARTFSFVLAGATDSDLTSPFTRGISHRISDMVSFNDFAGNMVLRYRRLSNMKHRIFSSWLPIPKTAHRQRLAIFETRSMMVQVLRSSTEAERIAGSTMRYRRKVLWVSFESVAPTVIDDSWRQDLNTDDMARGSTEAIDYDSSLPTRSILQKSLNL